MAWSKKYKRSIDCNNPKGFSQKAHCAGRRKRENIMKLSEFKTEVRKIVQERSINAIAKQQQKVADGIAKALELYKKVKNDKTSSQYKKAIDALRKLNDEKKKLANEMDVAVSSKMRNVGLSDKFESVNEMDPYIKPVKRDDEEEVEEGFASDAQRRAAFASGYKAKGKKGKKKNESINEGPSTEEKRIAMLAVRKQAKYRNVDIESAIQDQINALMDLQRDVKRGKKIK
tara:strand:- start:812 stop:1501 length:690 start_codon:yes stop_codon:yes gene_type:complete